MSKKSELKKKIAEAQAKITSLRETPSPTLGVAMLIETEMEKYQLILSAKAIPDRLQKFAEQIAKIEADDLMPVIDEYRKMFGREAGEKFHRETVGSLRALMDQVQKTKDTVNANIEALESGSPMNDMTTGAGMDDMGGDDLGADAAASDDLGADAGADMGGDDMEMSDDMGGDEGGELPPEKPAPEVEPGLGRAMKESRRLKNSSNPDAIVLEAFISAMGANGRKAKLAAESVAKRFSIDVADVKEIVREAASEPRPF
jgi:hypothetical protein